MRSMLAIGVSIYPMGLARMIVGVNTVMMPAVLFMIVVWVMDRPMETGSIVNTGDMPDVVVDFHRDVTPAATMIGYDREREGQTAGQCHRAE